MTYQLKGFVKIKPKINNAIGIVSAIGELSTYSQTFTKELAEFDDSRWGNVAFVVFQSVNTTGPLTVQRTFSDHILEVSEQVYSFCENYNGLIAKVDILNNILASYAGVITDVNCGTIITASGITMPEWLSWTNTQLPSNVIKVWFSDPAFRRQYNETEIVVIPPIDNLDDFFKPAVEVKKSIAARTGARTAELVQTAKNGHPETIYRVDDFEFISPTNQEYKPKVSWNTLIYGPAGDNNDLVKQAIKEFCITNSNYDLSQWAIIFPDIFKTTEFTIVPYWSNVAIPNRTTQAGLFSPLINPNVAIDYVKNLFDSTMHNHIVENMQITGHNYRSICMAIFGGAENKNSKFKITDYYPDYIDVGTNSPDFSRMEKATQDWAYMVANLLVIAENPDQYTDLPPKIKKMTRGGVTYISQTFDNILYMVAVKATVTP